MQPQQGRGNWNGGQRRGGSAFSGIENAQVSPTRNPYITEGDYILEVTSCFLNSGQKGDALIVECLVHQSSGPMDQAGNPMFVVEGSPGTIYLKKNESFLSNCKALAIACMGFDEQGNPCPKDYPLTTAESEAILDGPEPFAVGKLLYVEARQQTSSKGAEYTRYSYWPVAWGADGKPDPSSIKRI
jgi:hypothetical protein